MNYFAVFYTIAGIVLFTIFGLFVIGILNAMNERKRLDIEAMQTRIKCEAYRDRGDALTLYRR